MAPLDDAAPYRRPWQLGAARRYFARPPLAVAVSFLSERLDHALVWREVRYTPAPRLEALATVVTPLSGGVTRGVVLAHGGSDDGRRFFLSEAADLAANGAAVILPVTRIRLDDGVDAFATDVRRAVLTERAALDVLLEAGAPRDGLSFLGHSAGGVWAATLCAVEPRLSRIVIFANGAGPLAKAALAAGLSRTRVIAPADLNAVADWFDLAHFVAADRHSELFVQHGRNDRSVPIEAAKALFDAAAEPKRWVEYDWDHGLDADPQARRDRVEFVFGPSPFR